MFISAIAWAIFRVLGKKSKNAILNATDSFVKATIITIIFGIFYVVFFEYDFRFVF